MRVMDPRYLAPTAVIDADAPAVTACARRLIRKTADAPVAKAVALFYGVRDDIRYDPYCPFYRPEHYRASRILAQGRGYCVSKAGLLCALGRACGIPSRVGFASVRNHLATGELIRFMGTDLFVYHGYTEFFLEGKWVKATPAFNQELCRRHHVAPLDFDGRSDAVFQAFNSENQPFMTYVEAHGVYADIPVEKIVAAWKKAYGPRRVENWIKGFEKSGGRSGRDFYRETVIGSRRD